MYVNGYYSVVCWLIENSNNLMLRTSTPICEVTPHQKIPDLMKSESFSVPGLFIEISFSWFLSVVVVLNVAIPEF